MAIREPVTSAGRKDPVAISVAGRRQVSLRARAEGGFGKHDGGGRVRNAGDLRHLGIRQPLNARSDRRRRLEVDVHDVTEKTMARVEEGIVRVAFGGGALPDFADAVSREWKLVERDAAGQMSVN